MCQSCDYEDTIADVERMLVQSKHAPWAVELIVLRNEIEKKLHVGDAVNYRIEDIKKLANETEFES